MDFSNILVIIYLYCHVVETLKLKCVLSGRDGKRKITFRYFHAKELYFEPFSERHHVHRSNTTIVSSLKSQIVATSQQKCPLSCASRFKILDHILNQWKKPSKWLTLPYIIITVFYERKAYYINLTSRHLRWSNFITKRGPVSLKDLTNFHIFVARRVCLSLNTNGGRGQKHSLSLNSST